MILIRRTMAAIRALLKKRKSLSPELVEEVRKRGPKPLKSTKISKPVAENEFETCAREENWLILLTSGLEEVSAMMSSELSSHERILFLVLDNIGLQKFLTDVWQWQSEDICQDFVCNWEHTSKTTTARGVHIDVSYHNFLAVTGFAIEARQATHDSTGSSYSELEQGHEGIREKRTVVYETEEHMTISQALRKDRVLQSLLLLLNRTLWFANMESYCPTKDKVYLLVQSLRGHKLDWSKCVYEKFIGEIRDLQDRHDNFPNERLQTLAGPLMCFLYSRAQHKALYLQDSEFQENSNDINLTTQFRKGGRAVLKDKKLDDYHDDDELVPSGFSSRTLRLPFPPSVLPRKRRFEDYNLFHTNEDAEELEETAWNMTDENSNLKCVGDGTEFTEEIWKKLNETFEEQKHRQERFKLHLRQSWKRAIKAECEFGCCT